MGTKKLTEKKEDIVENFNTKGGITGTIKTRHLLRIEINGHEVPEGFLEFLAQYEEDWGTENPKEKLEELLKYFKENK